MEGLGGDTAGGETTIFTVIELRHANASCEYIPAPMYGQVQPGKGDNTEPVKRGDVSEGGRDRA